MQNVGMTLMLGMGEALGAGLSAGSGTGDGLRNTGGGTQFIGPYAPSYYAPSSGG